MRCRGWRPGVRTSVWGKRKKGSASWQIPYALLTSMVTERRTRRAARRGSCCCSASRSPCTAGLRLRPRFGDLHRVAGAELFVLDALREHAAVRPVPHFAADGSTTTKSYACPLAKLSSTCFVADVRDVEREAHFVFGDGDFQSRVEFGLFGCRRARVSSETGALVVTAFALADLAWRVRRIQCASADRRRTRGRLRKGAR